MARQAKEAAALQAELDAKRKNDEDNDEDDDVPANKRAKNEDSDE